MIKRFLQSEITHGTGGLTFAVIVSSAAQYLSAWLQVASYFVSLLIGIATLISIVRKLRSKGQG